MAPVTIEPNIRYTPIAVVALHFATVIYLTSAVGLGFYRSYKALGPSQDVRTRLSRRQKLVPVFVALAVLGLALATHSATTYASLSYRVWADERGIEVPSFLSGVYNTTDASDPPQIYLARWLSDVPVYQDALEIIVEKARRFWWGQQIELSMISWSLLLAIEGRRRRIPFLWAFVSLAHLVSLSFAQNLFYIALLLTPAPLPLANDPPSTRLARMRESLFPPKPPNWCPNPGLFLLLLNVSFGGVFLLPSAAGTDSFNTVMGFSRAMTFAPLLLYSVARESWGTVHEHPHKAYNAFTDLFRFISLLSLALHGKATLIGLVSNVPDAHYHRHSNLLPWDIEKRSQWERTTTAFGKILGSTSDHPVVSAIGRDVLLSGFSLGLWAAVRALNARDILLSVIPLYKGSLGQEEAVGAEMEITPTSSEPAHSEEPSIKSETGAPSSTRRKGRQARGKSAGISNDDAITQGSTRRRGRTRKVKPDPEEAEDDTTYEPTPKERATATEGDVLPSQSLDWESAALAWGLSAFGGLGVGSAGVFGGECISR